MNGDQVREMRTRLAFTQKSLAERLGVSANSIARWERDEVPIPPLLEHALKGIECERDLERALKKK